jgi:hypothetical protein
LRALWGNRNPDSPAPKPPNADDAIDRRNGSLPASVKDAPTIELGEVVAEADRRRYRAALRKAGVPEKQLEKMKNLDGLATSTGMLISVSLQQTHQNYIGQLHMLSSACDDLHERLKGVTMEDGTVVPLDAESASFLYRCYTEMVKEQGRGYQLMMEGAQALIRMMMMAKGDDPEGRGAQKKPGWGKPKKVN